MERNTDTINLIITSQQPSQIKMANKLIQLKDGNDNVFLVNAKRRFILSQWGFIPAGTHSAGEYRYTSNAESAIHANELIFVCYKTQGSNRVYQYAHIETPFETFDSNGNYYEVAITDGKIKVWVSITQNDELLVDLIENSLDMLQILYRSNDYEKHSS